MKEKYNCQPKTPYPGKNSSQNWNDIKAFSDIQKVKEPPGDPPYKLLQKGNRKKENDNRNVTINEGEHPKWGVNMYNSFSYDLKHFER